MLVVRGSNALMSMLHDAFATLCRIKEIVFGLVHVI
jgi:hypothetical protein